jgi:very-short-patch-repair endonuclease
MTENPLTATHPEIAKDWDLEKNGSLLPEHVNSYSKEVMWWRCVEGHEYQVSVYSRVRSGGCKVCQRSDHAEIARLTKLKKSKSLANAQPQLITEWDSERNKGLSPDTVFHKSHRPVWWKCKYGHTWQSTPQRRSRGDACPTCAKNNAGDRVRKWRLEKAGQSFADAYPELLEEWDYKKNILQPTEIAPKSNYRASWRCKYGHEWNATVDNRTHNESNCPQCRPQSSRIEIYLLCELKVIFSEVRWRSKISGVECDIYIPDLQLGIEVDGEYWHKNRAQKDRNKTQHLTWKGIHLIRVRDSRLPFVDGTVVEFRPTEDLQQVILRLLSEIGIHFTSDKLDAYLAEGVQKNASAYKEIIARLPAPPSGETLEDLNPEVASQWDYEANLPLTPALFSTSSDQKVAWVCPEGHHWDATIKNRTQRKSGCPSCYEADRSAIVRRGRARNTLSLAQSNPAYLIKFDTEKNGFPPIEIAFKSGLKVWWHCENGHSFQRSPFQMKKTDACPVCNSLPFAYPQVAEQWDIEKNNGKNPADYSWGSNERVWWRCSKGHSWQVAINQRTSAGYGCAQCYYERRRRPYQEPATKRKSSLADSAPSYLAEWDYTKNVDISPDSVTAKTKRKVWWVCPESHSYIQSLDSKARGSICPVCAKIKRAESTRRAKLARTGSLADNHPDIAKQWHQKKNGNLSPSDISSGSHRVVWWCCDNGHEWKECPNTRTYKRRPKGLPSV